MVSNVSGNNLGVLLKQKQNKCLQNKKNMLY